MRIMIVTDGVVSGTGFGEEMRNCAFRWAQNGHEIIFLSLQHFGYPIEMSDNQFPDLPHKGAKITVVGNYGSPLDLGTKIFPSHYKEYCPDIVLLLGDPWILRKWIPLKKKMGFPLVFYVTLDGLPVNIRWLENLNNTNLRISMTEWARDEYAKVGVESVPIHHGINNEWWATTKENKLAMQAKYGLDPEYTYFISWDCNQWRKRQDVLLRCWKKFRPETKKAKLILWTDWWCRLGWDLEYLIAQYKIPRDTVISPSELTGRDKFWEMAESPSVHREIAMTGHIYLSGSSGEGFGKCNLETISLGIPPIVTDYSAIPEVVGEAGILIPITGTFRWHDNIRTVDGGLVNEDLFLEAMNRLYDKPDEVARLGELGIQRAKQFNYDKEVIPRWLSVFDQINPDVIFARELGLI